MLAFYCFFVISAGEKNVFLALCFKMYLIPFRNTFSIVGELFILCVHLKAEA